MKRALSLLLMGIILAVLSSGWTTDGWAQRDVGAKARGEFGTGFWNSKSRQSTGRASYQPAQASTESYRRFSYQPTRIQAGDNVIVKGDGVKLMKGANTVGVIGDGTKFKVTKVIDGWLGSSVEVEGRKLAGWVWHESVALAE